MGLCVELNIEMGLRVQLEVNPDHIADIGMAIEVEVELYIQCIGLSVEQQLKVPGPRR